MDRSRIHLLELTDPAHPDGFLAGGVARINANGTENAFVTGRAQPGRHSPWVTDPSVRLRFASVSKAATAAAACELIARGRIDPAAPLASFVPDIPSHWPAFTITHLLSHTSGITDLGGYLFDPPVSPVGFLSDRFERCMSGTEPGRYFRYANLNYVLLGSILEHVTGTRFDDLLKLHVLEPAGIEGGFNWAGLSPEDRQNRLGLFQRQGSEFYPTADQPDADWAAEVVPGDGRGVSLGSYVLGRDTLAFSPHAGLRMSVIEAARLARFLSRDTESAALQRQIVWDASRDAGMDCDGLYQAFGLGLMHYRQHPLIGPTLYGHAGQALGFTGGAWVNAETGDACAYFLSGSADETAGLADEVFYRSDELAFLNMT